jgi:hypothetical protein
MIRRGSCVRETGKVLKEVAIDAAVDAASHDLLEQEQSGDGNPK